MSDILLVEDNPNDAELTMRALKKSGLADRLTLVQDGAEALEYLFAQGRYAQRDVESRPKVIFLDLKLPKIDGIEVLRRVRADERLKSIPVVVLTSSHEERDVVDVEFDKFYQAVAELGAYWLVLNKSPN
jgi:CheY-like chemotaxis protein